MALANNTQQAHPQHTSWEERELMEEIQYCKERLAEIGTPANRYEELMYPVYLGLLERHIKQLSNRTTERPQRAT